MTGNDGSPVAIRKSPSIEDLIACLERARTNVGQPVVISWKTKETEPTYLLTVTYGGGPSPATWILHAGDDESEAVVWIAMTTDLKEIQTKIKKALNETSSHSIADAIRTTGTFKKPDRKSTEEVEQSTAIVKKGTVFADRYEIGSMVGQGGMGIVYKATRVDTGQILALKILHPHLVTDSVSRARFEQEAQKSELDHRNLIKIHQFGFSKAGQPFIAMDYINGSSMNELLSHGPLNHQMFTSIFTQVAEGLHYAHIKGVVHRDIKPGNIMICRGEGDSPIVKIVDFGIAKQHIVGGQDARLTPTGEVLGSPLYMSPEQCAGGAPDPRSDIYSLGCVMYEAVTGQVPFNHTNPIKVILMQLSEMPPSFKDANPEGHYSLEQEKIVMKALEKDPSRRYQTAEELGHDLWQLTVLGGVGAVRVFGGEFKKAGAATADAQQANPAMAPGSDEIVDALKSAGKPKKMMTLRFRKFRAPFEKDLIVQALNLGQKLIKKGADLSILLDYETANLAQRSDYMSAEFHTDLATTEKIKLIQSLLEKVIKAGGDVVFAEQWARYFGMMGPGKESFLVGATMLNDDQLAEYLLERASSFMEYT